MDADSLNPTGLRALWAFLPGGRQWFEGRWFMALCYLVAGLLGYVLFFPVGLFIHFYSMSRGHEYYVTYTVSSSDRQIEASRASE